MPDAAMNKAAGC